MADAPEPGVPPRASVLAAGMPSAGVRRELSAEQFRRVADVLHRACRIHLLEGKESLVQSRLAKRLDALGLDGFDQYLRLIDSPAGRDELLFMVDALTTNKTGFFREAEHFEFLQEQVRARSSPEIPWQIWSAGCSSGQEPYSIAMALLEVVSGDRDLRILATDISSRMLDEAREGIYGAADLGGLPETLVRRYFAPLSGSSRDRCRISPRIRELVRFARLNLAESWPMRGPFDFIFCRNVMIYFDRPTQAELAARFRELLRPGGYLVLGLAESLAVRDDGFAYVRPAVYRR